MTDWVKSGARSRQRGYRFERTVAELLGWSRVPYSGASAAYGQGDVIDGYINGPGYWMVECKMRTMKKPGSVRVDGKWIEQADRSAELSGRFPIIIVGSKDDHKKPKGLVFFSASSESAAFLADRITHAKNTADFPWLREPAAAWTTKSTSHSGGFSLRRSLLNTKWRTAILTVQARNVPDRTWAIMSLVDFVDLMRNMDGACVPGPFSEEAQ